VPRRADPRIAIFARRELVRPDASANALRSLQMIEAETIRQGEVPGRHRLIDGDGDDCARSLRRQSRLSSIDNADPCRVARGDAQRNVRVELAPAGIPDDRVRGERPPLAGGQHEWPRGIIAGWDFSAEGLELAEKLRNVQFHAAVVGLDASQRFVVVVDREHHARRTGDNRIEEIFARLEPFTETGTPNTLLRRGLTKESLPNGTEITVDGYQSKDGSRRANGRDLTLPNGQTLFLGSSGTGAPDEKKK